MGKGLYLMNDEDVFIESYDEDFCPECEELNYPIGSLGKRIHYTCRYCGIWWSNKMESYDTQS